jgi:patatin-related protein
MSDAAATAKPDAAQQIPYAHEVRFGVVMYGGVSLAIYINGVANELYEMACSTPKGNEDVKTGSTRAVYRKASWLLRNPDLRARYLEYVKYQRIPEHERAAKMSDPLAEKTASDMDQRTRFVVDTIAGTSAGGINGLFLAKALANGQKFAPLKDLWIQEGDIDRLLNDDASYKGLAFAKTDSPPQSLLNSDRMYLKLLGALRDMPTEIPLDVEGKSPLVDEIDLFVTTTDIRGAVVPLRLFDKVVYEKRYKQAYHFQYEAGDDNDLADVNSPFLAFAARCTSSFPFAFEPMSVQDAERLCNARPTEPAVDFDNWKSFFTGLSIEDMSSDGWRKRAFGDGGYLDNKPFSYVVEALSWRLGGLPMDRKLIYVEPAPLHPELERQGNDKKPDAIQNALAALISIPQDETIRADLMAVLTRNRRIERVERLVRDVETDIEMRDVDPFARIELDKDGKVPSWRSRDMGRMIDYYGEAFLPYRRLRMMTVTDDIADRLADWWSIDRNSDRLYALRAVVRAWRTDKYYENQECKTDRQAESVNAFLDDYDVKYRLRRTGFVLRKVHQLLSLVRKLGLADKRDPLSDIEKRLEQRWQRSKWQGSKLPPLAGLSKESREALLDALRALAGGFGKSMDELRKYTWPKAPDGDAGKRRKEAFETLDRVLRLLLGEVLHPPLTELETTADGTVKVLTKELPPPSPLRTLQENVFERASALFKLATGTQKTKIQELLEADVERLQALYAVVIGRSREGEAPVDGKTPVIRALLGNPRLVPVDAANPGDRPEAKVVIRIDDVPGCAALNTPEGKYLRKFISEYYVRFDEYDQMSFPLYYDTGTGEPATVEVLRVSPEDAPSLIDEGAGKRRKLAGTEVFHFGAFLDAEWRRNDIMWGRLDGCERLLAALFPETVDKEIREALLQEAQRTIVREEMRPDGYEKLIVSFTKALASKGQEVLGKTFGDLWADIAPTYEAGRWTKTGEILQAILGDEGMVAYLGEYYEVNRKLDTQTSLKTSARALTITGRILEEVEKGRRGSSSWMVWLTRAGRGVGALLAVSTPGSLQQAFFRHWLALLYVVEALLVGIAMLLQSTTVRNVGLTALGLTAAVHIASQLTGDFISRGNWWLQRIWRVFVIVVLAVLLVLALLGGLALYDHGLQGMICANGHQTQYAILRWICERL